MYFSSTITTISINCNNVNTSIGEVIVVDKYCTLRNKSFFYTKGSNMCVFLFSEIFMKLWTLTTQKCVMFQSCLAFLQQFILQQGFTESEGGLLLWNEHRRPSFIPHLFPALSLVLFVVACELADSHLASSDTSGDVYSWLFTRCRGIARVTNPEVKRNYCCCYCCFWIGGFWCCCISRLVSLWK